MFDRRMRVITTRHVSTTQRASTRENMAEARLITLTGEAVNPLIKTRKSYSREEKLKVVGHYYSEGQNLYQTCKRFSLNTKTVLRWLKDEEKIRGSKKGSKRVKFQRQARFPEMEKILYLEYKELRRKGMKARETICQF